MNYQEDLDVLSKEHDPSTVQWSERVPDDTYQARLDVAKVTRSKTSERLQTVFEFEIMHGDQQGRTVAKFSGMETKVNLDFLTKDIWTLVGEKIPFKWSNVEKVYEKILDTIVEIKVITREGFTNIWIQKKITKLDEKQKEHGVTKFDEDVPF